MVKHIVFFRLKQKTPENLDRAVRALRGLEGRVETLRFIEVGVDYLGSERSYDIALTTHFDDRAGLDAYASHPNHLPVIQTMRQLCASSAAVDYEI